MESWVSSSKKRSLQDIVECYWYASDHPDDVMILPPAISNDVLLSLNPPTTIFADENERYALSGSYFSGIRSRFFYVDQHGSFSLYGIRFKPWVLAVHFNLTPLQQMNRFLSLDEYGENMSPFQELQNAIKNGLSKDEVVCKFDEFLEPLFPGDSPVQLIFGRIFAVANQERDLSIKELAERSGFSVSSLERYFKKFIGVTPGVLFRIIRYNEIWNALNDPRYASWSDIVYEHGYFDQAHFIKEFKNFTGKSPGAYMMARNSTLDRYRLY